MYGKPRHKFLVTALMVADASPYQLLLTFTMFMGGGFIEPVEAPLPTCLTCIILSHRRASLKRYSVDVTASLHQSSSAFRQWRHHRGNDHVTLGAAPCAVDRVSVEPRRRPLAMTSPTWRRASCRCVSTWCWCSSSCRLVLRVVPW